MTTIKPLQTEKDIVTVKVTLHETIPVTGSLLSGTYGNATEIRGDNIKTYSHGMFQSVYDYPFLSSSANHIFDITSGITTAGGQYTTTGFASGAAADSPDPTGTSRINIYNQMAQYLVGFDATGSNKYFRVSGTTSGEIIDDPMFVNFSRLLHKDEIEKGTFRLTLGTKPDYSIPDNHLLFIGDYGAATSFDDTNSPAGEFGILRSGSSATATDAAGGAALGLIYYQAGVVVLDVSASLFKTARDQAVDPDTVIFVHATDQPGTPDLTYTGSVQSGTMDQLADALRHRVYNLEFNNTTELNSTIYFCRAGTSEFNYSSNPTYVSGSEIINKNSDEENLPTSYITTIGLYSDANQLLAVAKLSEPLKKTPENELTFRVRLDY